MTTSPTTAATAAIAQLRGRAIRGGRPAGRPWRQLAHAAREQPDAEDRRVELGQRSRWRRPPRAAITAPRDGAAGSDGQQHQPVEGDEQQVEVAEQHRRA